MEGKTKAFLFKVARRGDRSVWRRIEIKGNQTLADFDNIIRLEFNLDNFDHLSEFYSGKNWAHSGYGIITPDGTGEGADIQISSLILYNGAINYVYDFGTETHLYAKLEKISDVEPNVYYPRTVSQNEPHYKFCEECMARGKKTVAEYECYTCSEESEKPVYICGECSESEKHEDHYVEEILY